jgi:hypothetical protein
MLTSIVLDATERASLYHLTAHEQESKGYHHTLPFHQFIENGIEDPERCGNCLDSPGLRAETPPFIM